MIWNGMVQHGMKQQYQLFLSDIFYRGENMVLLSSFSFWVQRNSKKKCLGGVILDRQHEWKVRKTLNDVMLADTTTFSKTERVSQKFPKNSL